MQEINDILYNITEVPTLYEVRWTNQCNYESTN